MGLKYPGGPWGPKVVACTEAVGNHPPTVYSAAPAIRALSSPAPAPVPDPNTPTEGHLGVS